MADFLRMARETMRDGRRFTFRRGARTRVGYYHRRTRRFVVLNDSEGAILSLSSQSENHVRRLSEPTYENDSAGNYGTYRSDHRCLRPATRRPQSSLGQRRRSQCSVLLDQRGHDARWIAGDHRLRPGRGRAGVLVLAGLGSRASGTVDHDPEVGLTRAALAERWRISGRTAGSRRRYSSQQGVDRSRGRAPVGLGARPWGGWRGGGVGATTPEPPACINDSEPSRLPECPFRATVPARRDWSLA